MIKEIIIDYKIRKLANKSNSDLRSTTNYSNVKKVGFVHSALSTGQMKKLDGFVKKLEFEGKTVQVCEFLGSQKREEDGGLAFSNKDLTISGNWKSPEVKAFVEEPFDYLINLDRDHNKYIDYIFATSKAKCRIGGIEHQGESPYEMIVKIASSKGLEEYLREVHRYLKIIDKNES